MKEAIEIVQQHISDDQSPKNFTDKWKDWKWQRKNLVTKVDTVEKMLGIEMPEDEKERIQQTIDIFPMAITPYYLSLINPDNYRQDPIFRQSFPDIEELNLSDCDLADPLSEDTDSPVPGITHRYPDRVLLHVSNICAMYCRHCTRKRKVGDRESIPDKDQILQGIEYIRKTPAIRDVLLSGGDPLMLSDEYLDWILGEIRKIDHVEIIRIGTRIPVVLPYRITDGLIEVIKKHGVIWVNTQFNHPNEITETAQKALEKLAFAGVPLGNQSVLLKDVNDCPRIIKKLVQKLVENRVRPYYLYQCDLSEGLEHFRTSVGKGIEIMESLRGHTSGYAVPTYVIDAPGGGGKIPVMPNYLISWSSNKVILRNFEGVITTYKVPDNHSSQVCDLECDSCNLQLDIDNAAEYKAVGVYKLLSDYEDDITITPENLDRRERTNTEEE